VCPCTLCSWRNALQVNLLAYAITLASLTTSPVVRTKKRQSERVVFFHAAADLKQNYVLSANGTAFVCPCTLCSWRNALQVNLLAYAITFVIFATSPVVRTKSSHCSKDIKKSNIKVFVIAFSMRLD
jgi:uncharacterized protein (DUF2062 family)